MIIKEGFNGKETNLRINIDDGQIQLWIEETGKENSRETLSYLTPDELYLLFKEVKEAGERLFK